MDKLEITEEHKRRLIQMCTDLIGICYFNNDETIGFRIDATESVDIPWLEVCILHLPKALSTPNNRAMDISVRQSYHIHEFYHHPKHVVDYLYNEYQTQRVWSKSK